MTKPNFFLAGAPKSGTTAMSAYLMDHPEVFLSTPKEPCYWSDDMPGIRAHHGINDLDAYLELFSQAIPGQSAVGEGSTNYLVSQVAIENILSFNPQAKFIVMVRNPVDLVHSLHTHNFSSGWDDQPDFRRAWSLQSDRLTNNNIPQACLNPTMLQYKTVGSLGTQVQRALQIVSADRLQCILYDDFRDSPRDTYLKVLSFLGLPDDQRTDFPAINAAVTPRWLPLTRAMQSQPAKQMTRLLKTKLSGPLYKLANRTKRSLSTKPQSKTPLDPEFQRQLAHVFADEVSLLADLLGRDLTSWKVMNGPS